MKFQQQRSLKQTLLRQSVDTRTEEKLAIKRYEARSPGANRRGKSRQTWQEVMVTIYAAEEIHGYIQVSPKKKQKIDEQSAHSDSDSL